MIFCGGEEKRGLSEEKLGSADINATCSLVLVRQVGLLVWKNLPCPDKTDCW